MARCMLIEAGLDDRYWGEAVVTANYLQNRLPTRSIEGTPFELWFGYKPCLKEIKPFGCDVYCHVPKEKRGKLDVKAVKLKFMGYSETTKGYRLLDVRTRKVTISRDVKFLSTFNAIVAAEVEPHDIPIFTPEINVDHTPPATPEVCHEHLPVVDSPIDCSQNIDDDSNDVWVDTESSFPNQDDDSDDQLEDPLALNLRRSERSTKGILPQRYVCAAEEQEKEPRTYSEAQASRHRNEWQQAMLEELEAIRANNTWNIVDLPVGARALGSKWVYKMKLGADGTVKRFKARLVAQGFNQRYGTEYDEVFAPVVRLTTFRALLSIAARRDMVVQQYDVKSAFLYGNLEEEIFIRQPPGFAVKGSESKVCRLNKSLYGLKQAARSWNIRLHEVLVEEKFQRCESDPCLYRKKIGEQLCFVLVYVDDLIVSSDDRFIAESLEKALKRNFDISCLGEVRQYLGVEVERNAGGDYFVSQQRYIADVVSAAGLEDAKDSSIPLDVGYYKQENDSSLLPNNHEYQRLIGKLLFIAVNTRPDVAASVSILSRQTSKPTQRDWNELKRVIRYLKGSANLKLRLSDRMDNSGLVGFADADWAECRDDRKSNSGYIFQYSGGTISWACRKQSCVSVSTAEAEFVALSEASQEGLWLKRLMLDLGEKIDVFKMNDDNQSCLRMLDCEKFSNRTKHIDTKYYFTKDLKQSGQVEYRYCPGEVMKADLLTKPLPRVRLQTLRKLCGIITTTEQQ